MKKTLIERVEVGAGGAASIEFTGIPQDGVDLLLVVSGRSTLVQPTNLVYCYLNSDTTNSNYTYNILRATMFAGSGGGGVQAITNNYRPFWAIPAAEASSDTFSSDKVLISNYTSTTNKSISIDTAGENFNSGSGLAEATLYVEAATYTTTSGITSLLIDPAGNNFAQYSTASLYKITAGNDGTTTVR